LACHLNKYVNKPTYLSTDIGFNGKKIVFKDMKMGRIGATLYCYIRKEAKIAESVCH
jgi:hypothetical protein